MYEVRGGCTVLDTNVRTDSIQSENIYVALDESTDATATVANDPDKVDLNISREMFFETGAQFGMVNGCWETKTTFSGRMMSGYMRVRREDIRTCQRRRWVH
jgi:hypothetical protein